MAAPQETSKLATCSMRKISLDNGILTVDICPDCGGGVSALRLRDKTECPDLLRPATEDALASGAISDMSCLPVTPFAGRLPDNMTALLNHQIDLTASLPTGGLPLPQWTVQDASHIRATLTCYHSPGEDAWPWAYQTLQRFQLTEDSVSIYLAMTNVGKEPMLGGIGFSLNLERRNGLILNHSGTAAAGIPAGRPLGERDHYANLDGHETRLHLLWPEEQLALTSDDSGWWHLTDANAINDQGQIVGWGTIDGKTHAYRLDPLPSAAASGAASFVLENCASIGEHLESTELFTLAACISNIIEKNDWKAS